MKTGKRRNIKSGEQYNRFFAKPDGVNLTVEKEARLADTIKWMKQVIAETLGQTKEIARWLQGASELLTCKNIWEFCFGYFQYKKDKERTEQIRTPNRAWWDRKKGIDCDCFTVLIGSILTHLKIPYVMRMTRYHELDFEHIYPVAFTDEGEVIIDAVVHQFNYEVPYTEKEDIEMELQVLSGTPASLSNNLSDKKLVEREAYNEFGDKVRFEHDLPIDAEDLFLDPDEMVLDGLDGRAERLARKAARKKKRATKKATRKRKRATNKANRKARNEEIKNLPLKERVKARVGQGLHIINKFNPATALLRAGVLASMKLNLMKVASHLRFAYWSEDEAMKNDMDMTKFNQLQRIREKLEKIYFGAGGKPEALKKAILQGKGNRNRMVQLSGLGEIIQDVSDDDDLRTILGEELYYEELNGFDGLDGLGEPVTTGAAIAAASGAIATLAALIKKLGNLFKKGSASEQKFQIQDNADNEEEKTRKFSFDNIKRIVNNVKTRINNFRSGESKGSTATRNPDGTEYESSLTPIEPLPEEEFILDESGYNYMNRSSTRTEDSGSSVQKSEDDQKDDNWFKKNWKWLVPVAGAATLGTILTIRAVKKGKGKKATGSKTIGGVTQSKKRKNSKSAKTVKRTTSKKTNRSTNRKKPSTRKKTTRKKSTGTGIKKYELM
ncbi:MAG: hypothetical protein HUJ25_07585 [Crocinitomicaceae bacterium]|nr:hypothetical protein [Crocinitomicaceae bacterium]